MMKMEWIVFYVTVSDISKGVWKEIEFISTIFYCIIPLAQGFYWLLRTRKQKITSFFLLDHSLSSEVFLFPLKKFEIKRSHNKKKFGSLFKSTLKKNESKRSYNNFKSICFLVRSTGSFPLFSNGNHLQLNSINDCSRAELLQVSCNADLCKILIRWE